MFDGLAGSFSHLAHDGTTHAGRILAPATVASHRSVGGYRTLIDPCIHGWMAQR
jgi:hypothetical protein